MQDTHMVEDMHVHHALLGIRLYVCIGALCRSHV
jgi:hypothetical protein